MSWLQTNKHTSMKKLHARMCFSHTYQHEYHIRLHTHKPCESICHWLLHMYTFLLPQLVSLWVTSEEGTLGKYHFILQLTADAWHKWEWKGGKSKPNLASFLINWLIGMENGWSKKVWITAEIIRLERLQPVKRMEKVYCWKKRKKEKKMSGTEDTDG